MFAYHNPNQIFLSEPNWKSYVRAPYTATPTGLRSWLLDRGSLTQRLMKLSRGEFKVEVLTQQMASPMLSEIRALGMPLRQKALIRQVILYGCNIPLVYARSVIPVKTLTGRLKNLRKLNNKPLGALLFRDIAMQRGDIEIGCLQNNGYLHQEFANNYDAAVWGRRSLFYLDKKPLLVSELFIPGFNKKLLSSSFH